MRIAWPATVLLKFQMIALELVFIAKICFNDLSCPNFNFHKYLSTLAIDIIIL